MYPINVLLMFFTNKRGERGKTEAAIRAQKAQTAASRRQAAFKKNVLLMYPINVLLMYPINVLLAVTG